MQITHFGFWIQCLRIQLLGRHIIALCVGKVARVHVKQKVSYETNLNRTAQSSPNLIALNSLAFSGPLCKLGGGSSLPWD